jgi:hypothetical protein
MQSHTRRSTRLLATLAVAGLVGIATLPKNDRAPTKAVSQIIDVIVDAFRSTAAQMKAAAGHLGGGIEPGQSHSTRQGNDSFRMHAGLDLMILPPGQLALIEEERQCL